MNFNDVPFDMLNYLQKEAENNINRNKRLQKMVVHDPEPQVGLTPKETIWSRNKAKIYHYFNDNIKHKTPILMIYALINRPYVMDLCPGNSMVEYLVNQGFDVYMVDWGHPGIEDKHLKYDDYVMDYLPEIFNKVMDFSKAEKISLIGYCMGGTICSMFAATHPNLPISSITFLASPIDFADAGLYTSWLDPATFNVDKMVDVMGNIPPEVIDFGNKMLKPVTNFVSSYVGLWENMTNEGFVENWRLINHWVNDGTPFPGEAFRQWIKEFYQKNALVNKQLFLNGQQVDLAKITCPILNLVGDKDHIALPNQSSALKDHVSSKDYNFVAVPAGHVSLTIGKQAKKITWPTMAEFLAKHD